MTESEPNTFLDGCGVLADTDIGRDVRIRFRLAEDRQQDISVVVQDGELHIYGQYRPVIITFDQANHISVGTQVWAKPKCPTYLKLSRSDYERSGIS